jgi:hypothetical protein
MADGRAFGLLPYQSPGNLNSATMTQFRATDGAQYRETINQSGYSLIEFNRALTMANRDVTSQCSGVPTGKVIRPYK